MNPLFKSRLTLKSEIYSDLAQSESNKILRLQVLITRRCLISYSDMKGWNKLNNLKASQSLDGKLQ